LNTTTLALLPKGAALVNAACGAHLVEENLLAALASGQISAAVLDVFREEPLPADHPFWHHPRIVLTPHVAPLRTPRPPRRSSSTISAASKKGSRSSTGSIRREAIDGRGLIRVGLIIGR
jgi:phosphoglycerate dehydrogenase-like enzyme